jgi:hypothetical protein
VLALPQLLALDYCSLIGAQVGGRKPDPSHLCKTAQSGGSCLGRVVAWH